MMNNLGLMKLWQSGVAITYQKRYSTQVNEVKALLQAAIAQKNLSLGGANCDLSCCSF